jgi:CRISPR-associated (Cas) DxTHG family
VTTGAWLVTVLGTDPKPARYTLGGQSAEAVLVPLALGQLLPVDRRPTQILALCTGKQRRRAGRCCGGGLKGSSVEAHVVEIGADPTAATPFLPIVTTTLPTESTPAGLMIDVTPGFRHYSLLMYLTLQYLSAQRFLMCYDVASMHRGEGG